MEAGDELKQVVNMPREVMQYRLAEQSALCSAMKLRDTAGLKLFWAKVWGAAQVEVIALEVEFECAFRALCQIEARERAARDGERVGA